MIFLIGTGIALSFSSIFAILTIIPRLNIGYSWANFIFFKSIIEKEPEKYFRAWDDLIPSRILSDYLKNIYNLALIQEKKFENLYISVIMIIVGIVLLAVSLIVNYAIMLVPHL
jgi:hypothetical protein